MKNPYENSTSKPDAFSEASRVSYSKSEVLPLHSLLEESGTARRYYASLPDYVIGAVNQHADTISSEPQLHKCAETYRNIRDTMA